jgi:hypothetical protein
VTIIVVEVARDEWLWWWWRCWRWMYAGIGSGGGAAGGVWSGCMVVELGLVVEVMLVLVVEVGIVLGVDAWCWRLRR